MARNINRPDAAGAGHNSQCDEDTFFRHLALIVAANGPRDAAAAIVKSARKAARGDGVDLGKLDAMIKMSTWEPGEVRDHFATLNRYAAWMRLPVGTQLDLLEGVGPAEQADIDWTAKGFTAATTGAGTPGTPPLNCPADQVDAWMKGWHAGQAKNAPAPAPAALALHAV